MRELVVVEGDDIHGSGSFDEGQLSVGDVAAVFHPHAGGLVLTVEKFLTVRAAKVQPLSTPHGALSEVDSIEEEEFMHWSVCSAFMD